MGMRTKRLLVLAAAAAVLPCAGGAHAAPESPVAPAGAAVMPDLDPAFYRPAPEHYADLAPGELIAARAVTPAILAAVPVNVDAWQLSFRSTNSRGEAIAAVATVLEPRDAVPGRPLFSYQMAEDSTGSWCRPSYQLQQGAISPLLTGSTLVAAQFLEVIAALAQGWAVVIPDHQGPDSAYAAGPLAGRITLDGIRAAQNFAPMELAGTATQVGLMGYSGGAIATGHAAELAGSYAPELNIVGVAEGGVPADLAAALTLANGNLSSGLIFAGAIGVAREYPELRRFLEQNADPLGQVMLAAKDDLCASYQALFFPFGDNLGMIGRDPFADPVVREIFDRTRMGAAVPAAPVLIYQANADWLIPVGPVNRLVDTYCQDSSARVHYIRDHFSEHLTLDPIGAPRALLWLAARFAGEPVGTGCATEDVGSMALDPDTWRVWEQTVGSTVAALFQQPIGTR